MRISRDNKLWSVATRLSVAVITFAIGMAVYLTWTTRRTSPTPQQPPPLKVEKVEVTADIGTLKRDIQEAKARGENTVEIGAIGCGSAIGSLQQELSSDTVVLAEVTGKKTYGYIRSSYLVQVQNERDSGGTSHSSLSRGPIPGCPIGHASDRGR